MNPVEIALAAVLTAAAGFLIAAAWSVVTLAKTQAELNRLRGLLVFTDLRVADTQFEALKRGGGKPPWSTPFGGGSSGLPN